MSNPRVIAATASAALIAGVGAAAVVYAVDVATSTDIGQSSSTQADAEAEQSTAVQSPQDESTTVYRTPGDTSGQGKQFQPAPPTTQWNNGSGSAKSHSNTSKSS